MLTAEDAHRYSRFVEQYQRSVYPLLAARLRRLTRHVPEHALDLGCGPGYLTEQLVQFVAKVTALDINPAMLELTRKRIDHRASGVELRLGDVHALDFPDAHFDLVVSYSCFHHWERPVLALRECRRVLAPGGVIVLLDTDVDARAASSSLQDNIVEPDLRRFVSEAFEESYSLSEVGRICDDAHLPVSDLNPFAFDPADALEAMDFDPTSLDGLSSVAGSRRGVARPVAWLLVSRPD